MDGDQWRVQGLANRHCSWEVKNLGPVYGEGSLEEQSPKFPSAHMRQSLLMRLSAGQFFHNTNRSYGPIVRHPTTILEVALIPMLQLSFALLHEDRRESVNFSFWEHKMACIISDREEGAVKFAPRVFNGITLESLGFLPRNPNIRSSIGRHYHQVCAFALSRLPAYYIQRPSPQPSIWLLIPALRASSAIQELEQGRIIHGEAAARSLDSNPYVASALVTMYSRCGSTVDARRIFDLTPAGHSLASWTALMLAYIDSGDPSTALDLFRSRPRAIPTPDARAFSAAIRACCELASMESGVELSPGRVVKLRALEQGMAIHATIDACWCSRDLFLAAALVDFYARCGSARDCRRVFDQIDGPDVVAWTALVNGYADNGEAALALESFKIMAGSRSCADPDARCVLAAIKACIALAASEKPREISTGGKNIAVKMGALREGMELHARARRWGFEREEFLGGAIVDMYAKCGSLIDARMAFDRLPAHSAVTVSSIASAHASAGEGELALELLLSRELCLPLSADAWAMSAALKACATAASSLPLTQSIHARILRAGMEILPVLHAGLIDAYCKSGSLRHAQCLFAASASNDSIAWNALLAGLSHGGDIDRALELFRQMIDEGIPPVGASFVCAISACSHAGMVDRARGLFAAMGRCGVPRGIEHYHCMVDVLGRANRLEEAVAMVRGMPHEPTAVTWRTVLGACHKWKNAKVAKVAFQELVKIDPSDPVAYNLMANVRVFT
ncbi:pentatricopeptide repeat-containing protein At2g13600-like [Selaginella moellendorffii]|uniref:pentatricopeptide repeat-containing protein At2g13600-like n=1 Tax=Selaginella moellendorffii TaxID=88036 RepID=UPI000D1CBCB7|nr:pentatricopeptide repeat-containing protein At2g13600-like [Selaginella moellendorffii]|eukprot:XP_024524226.1 pentatricopeptide repeat-containing protein At2g13600-like [Selaginella moellendorffii]